ncbi:Transcriptional regulator, contains XRE-family HTH domain [Streptomyces sp. WMMB 714]|uniref:helix-turn-helix domain-containing protein n=1 Tax=Streptomyces sp. WMMB 714 TaxID=1286822 RepID=UPI0005F822B6|nr:helix-turn-helix transcriptional regulator [Streptomyces sp. WMMB 714]SCK19216.1 Transcriptional regulator, contains XRE-family HTH domain [Streptomyces sp. WMMB 714]
MPGPKDIDGSASLPTFYGKELRWKREQAGLTQQKLVDGSFYGSSHLSEIERGERRMPLDLAQHVDQVLGTDGFFARRCEDVRKAKRSGHASYFETVLEAEKRAETIEEWSPTLIPGLLQTEPYARTVLESTQVLGFSEEVDLKVNARLARASLFDEDESPVYWVVLHESLLRHPILPPQEMAHQLDHIAELGKRRRIIPQILPWNAGVHPLMLGCVTITTFADAPPMVYTEATYSGDTVDDPSLVRKYRRSYDLLRAVALPPKASLAMIEAAAEDFRSDKQPG